MAYFTLDGLNTVRIDEVTTEMMDNLNHPLIIISPTAFATNEKSVHVEARLLFPIDGNESKAELTVVGLLYEATLRELMSGSDYFYSENGTMLKRFTDRNIAFIEYNYTIKK